MPFFYLYTKYLVHRLSAFASLWHILIRVSPTPSINYDSRKQDKCSTFNAIMILCNMMLSSPFSVLTLSSKKVCGNYFQQCIQEMFKLLGLVCNFCCNCRNHKFISLRYVIWKFTFCTDFITWAYLYAVLHIAFTVYIHHGYC